MDGFEKEGGMNNFFHKRFSLPLSSSSHILPILFFFTEGEGEEGGRNERERGRRKEGKRTYLDR